MKQYYAYIAKDMVNYFETKLAEYGGSIIKRKPVLVNHGKGFAYYYVVEAYYYVVEAQDGVIDSKFEL